MSLGQKIKKLRREKNVTQKELADFMHVSFQTVSKWESDLNEPDIATIKQLAKFFDCTIESLINDEEEDHKEKENNLDESNSSAEQAEGTKTIIIHQYEPHVCAKCGKEIQEDELVSEDITKQERYGRATRTVSIGQTYYHKNCFEEIKKNRQAAKVKARKLAASKTKKICFGWSGAAGIVGLGVSLGVFLSNSQFASPGLGVLYSFLIGYALFAMVYCILCDSYISDVFFWCAKLSIKFPGLIFTFDVDGIIWVITMKILFAILGVIIGIFAIAFALIFSATLSSVSFPFILIHNIRNNYEDALFD